MTPKVAFIGAGSTVFTRNIVGDLLSFPALADTVTVALMDVDEARLRASESAIRGIVHARGARATVEATLDRREALDAADYVVTSFQVGGLAATRVDFDVAKRFGLRQTIADTVGVGGIMRALRTFPVLLDVGRDMEELCPDALLLQHVNPMAMLCWAAAEATSVRTVGLCHSVRHTAAELARDLAIPEEELEYDVAGINHMAFFLRLERAGEDLYPRLRKVAPPDWNRVRYEVLRHLGYFVTESSEHFAEYVPWFIKASRPDLVERFNVPLDEYLRRSEAQLTTWDDVPPQGRSGEYAAEIVNACETGEPLRFHANVPNTGGLIGNLPAECCVEVPCVASDRGIEPQPVGTLPRHLAALMQTNVNVQGLAVQALLSGDPGPAYHAAMLDPHTAAELPLEEIARLMDELLEAHAALRRGDTQRVHTA
jgi:alpha-galactosidase